MLEFVFLLIKADNRLSVTEKIHIMVSYVNMEGGIGILLRISLPVRTVLENSPFCAAYLQYTFHRFLHQFRSPENSLFVARHGGSGMSLPF